MVCVRPVTSCQYMCVCVRFVCVCVCSLRPQPVVSPGAAAGPADAVLVLRWERFVTNMLSIEGTPNLGDTLHWKFG